MANRVVTALFGEFVLGLALFGLTENVFGFFVGVGLSLLVVATHRP